MYKIKDKNRHMIKRRKKKSFLFGNWTNKTIFITLEIEYIMNDRLQSYHFIIKYMT